jgi:sporulation protein YlmC with PRC-barrel domain
VHLVRDLLDKQLLDPDQHKIGKVDGVVIEYRAGQQPRISALETGSGIVLDRLGWGTQSRRFRVDFEKVCDVGVAVTVGLSREEMPVTQWQGWLRRHILRWLPGGLS